MQSKAIEGFRLSPQQRHLWSLQQADHSLPYRAQSAIRIEGTLDTKLLKAAVWKVFARYEILRTTFHCLPGTTIPVQVIDERGIASIDSCDLSGWDPPQQAAEIERLWEKVCQWPFDLENGPLCRISLVTLSTDEHMLFVNLSSLCADKVSLRNLLIEISRSYSTRFQGMEMFEEPAQYADLAQWQDELLESEDTKTGRDYWRKQDLSALLSLTLPLEDQPSGTSGFQPLCVTSTIAPDIAVKLRELVRSYDATVSVFLLACWQSLLRRLTGQTDFVVGMACDGRTYEGLREAVGLFAKYLPLYSHLEESVRFSELLAQVNEASQDSLEWQEYFSWEQLAALNGDGKAPPFCAAGFEFEEEPAKHSAVGVTFSIQKQHACFDRFKVKLSCAQRADLLITKFHYDSNLFRAQDIERLAGQFQTLLESVTGNPEAVIGELAIVPKAERRRLLIELNDTRTDYPGDKCFHQLFEEQAQRTPDSVAVVCKGSTLSYAELNARANQLAHRLRSLGVGPETPVGICMQRCPEMVVGLLGIFKAGGAYVPLDPGYPRERLFFMLADAQPRVLLTQERVAAGVPEHGATVVCLEPGWNVIAGESEENPVAVTTPENLAYVIYTSGSTGTPKGILIPHRGLVNYLVWCAKAYAVDKGRGAPVHSSICFDLTITALFAPLLVGREVHLLEEDFGVEALKTAFQDQTEFSVVKITPAHLLLLSQRVSCEEAAGLTKAFIIGGENLLAENIAFWQDFAPDTILVNEYGPTESVVGCCVYQIPDSKAKAGSIPIGRPIANVEVYILDRYLQLVPIGVPGELHIGGAGLARGYLNRPDLTADKFVPNPFGDEPGARLYKTGDWARYLPDGNLEFLGRIDHQVKIRGFRIEPGEIEAVLGQHAAVREAVVLVQQDARGEKRLVAYVAAEQESFHTADDLRSFVRQKLPEYMVPSAFVLLDALPLMPNGKVDRRALPALDPARPHFEKALVAPRTPTEEVLAAIWAESLGIERVGIHDNFFDLGGHSLLATQVVSRMRDAFQVEIPLRRLFETPTVAGLAESVEAARRAGQHLHAASILPIARDADLPLSFAQQRLWFIGQLDPGNSTYNIPAAVRLRGSLNLSALERSVNEIVKRHEALRTTFPMVDGRPVQLIAPTLIMTLPVIDLRELPESERETEVQRLVAEEARKPFDFAVGPLVRITLVRVGEEEHVGLLTMHHIVSDGWSTGILIREMALLYDAFSSGRSSPLPELPIQYADFAHWQRQWLQGEILETQVGYWKEQLGGSPPLLELPTDHSRPPMQTFRGARQSFLLPKTMAEALKALSRQEGVTLFMTMLAAFKVFLSRYTGQDDLIVGTPIANRNRLETEGLIGCFVNTLVLRTDYSGNPAFRQALRRVREVCLAAYDHQDLPFERLVDELHLERDLSRNPLFQVMFVLQDALMRTVELPGLTLSPVKGDREIAYFDLTLEIGENEHGPMEVALVYNADLFEPGTIARMLGNLRVVLEAVVADPDQRISDVPFLTTAERRQLLEEWNCTKTASEQSLCIHQLFEAQAERTPDAIAVVFEHEQLTYGELNRRANQLARYLQALGVGPEVPVGLCLEPSLAMIVGLLGILKAGGVYLPLDPAYPKQRLSFILNDARVPVLLTQERLSVGLPEAKAVCLDLAWEAITRESAENPVSAVIPDNVAYVIYTSGSTGKPKGVLVSHGSIADHCRDVQHYYELDASDRVLQFASLSFDVSLEQILPTLIAGAKVVLARADVWHTNELHRLISEFGLTVLNLPTAYWQELVREWADNPKLLSSIRPRLFIVGGDAMSSDVLPLWQRTPVNSTRLLNAYGPTETTITATAFDITPRLCENATLQRIPIGRPLANTEIYILDQYSNPVPVGAPGELYIGGGRLARGYFNRPDLTAEQFVPHLFSAKPGARLYKTGDLARYLPDGNIEFLGRTDHQLKIRGFRIELGEIEAELRQHAAVRDAAVLAQEDTPGGKRLVAYVVAERESRPSANELRGFLRQKLPEYMLPAVFVPLDALPFTPNGKLDRGALPAPDHARPELEKAFVAPRSALELQLAHLWEEVLDLRPIGVTDNFFELGGHSLAAVRLFALIENRLGVRLPLAAVFQGATVEHLAGIVRNRTEPASPACLVPIQPGGSKQPLFLVHPAGGHVFPYVHLARYLGPDQPCYGLQRRGLEDGQEPHTRIEDMAAHYIEALRTVQLEGPYFLGGWSMGGVVAFEMARQLHAQGQRVALLALLDARIPTPEENFADEDFEATLLADFVRYFGLSLDGREALARLPKDELLARVLGQAKTAGLVPADIEASQAQHFIELCKADFRAARNYSMHRHPGRITLFKASQALGETSTDPTLGWSKWAAGGVEVHLVPGNHANMVYKPHVEVLAEKLSLCLNQAQSPVEWLSDGGEPGEQVMKVGK
jgi:amino acid adenylation domain-containing protein